MGQPGGVIIEHEVVDVEPRRPRAGAMLDEVEPARRYAERYQRNRTHDDTDAMVVTRLSGTATAVSTRTKQRTPMNAQDA